MAWTPDGDALRGQVAVVAGATRGADHGHVDVLVNDIWGGEELKEWDVPVWEHDLANGLRMLRLAIDTHLVTAVGSTAVALTPGWLRSEMMLEHFSATESRWQDAVAAVHSGELAREYGFTDLDGSQPDVWRFLEEVRERGLDADYGDFL